MNIFQHKRVTVNGGISLHYVECGKGPISVIFCHGWPELWYSWRHQMVAVAKAGYHVFALDQRGFGESSAPKEIEAYTMQNLTSDIVQFARALSLQNVVLVGHDWGGAVVWKTAQYHPDAVKAVASVNTPFFVATSKNPIEIMKENPGRLDYQLYFNEVGRAEAEFEKNVERTFILLFRTSTEGVKGLNTHSVRQRGGMLVGAPDNVKRSSMLTEEDLKYYVSQYTKSGFRGGLNWYRNLERNWQWERSLDPNRKLKVMQPALMVTAGKDAVLRPELTTGMEVFVPNLTRQHIADCGHWTQQECPEQLNNILVTWLNSVAPSILKAKL